MTLKSCPECGNNVSSVASTCPSCGFPLKEDPVLAYAQRRLDFGKKVVVGLIIVTPLFAVMGIVNTEFLGIAFGAGGMALMSLFILAIKQAQLDKSKLKK